MQLIPFIAESAADAVTQIRTRLGPDAVVVNIRPLPVKGMSRLWRKPRFEVLAHQPEPVEDRLDLTSDDPAIPGFGDAPSVPLPGAGRYLAPTGKPRMETVGGTLNSGTEDARWRVGGVLERAGFLPLSAQRVVDQLRSRHGESAPRAVSEELGLARRALSELWRQPPPFLEDTLRPHVLIGPAGVGKTTVLCKWLAHTVLVEGRSAQVWRLDGATANAAESLSIYCEILGVPIQRGWQTSPDSISSDIRFIDLPGVDWRDLAAVRGLGNQLKQYLSPHVHLVLNGAYDTSLLLAQVRAFSALPISDLVITHLDEESRWGKLWNLVLGTNYSVRFLSAGQNIPGDFMVASPETLLTRQFPA
ncbi:MAG: hypothetical protein H7X97_12110 [Opitutaceae bacterium]|nr:hypothetical protein [Verrucomicrobiales bacterium]